MANSIVYLILRHIGILALFFGVYGLLQSQCNLPALVFNVSIILFFVGLAICTLEAFRLNMLGMLPEYTQRAISSIRSLFSKMIETLSNIYRIVKNKIRRFICGQISHRKEESIPDDQKSSKEDNELFDESYRIISQNANYILVGNGLILTLFVALSKNGIEDNIIIDIIIVGTVVLSVLSCIRCFNIGLYPRLKKIDISLSKLKERENRAIINYSDALIFLCNTLVALFALFIVRSSAGARYGYDPNNIAGGLILISIVGSIFYGLKFRKKIFEA